ncbi:MAG: SMC family ATPase [Opitutales bacterium]|nr:SMC family ATPase [Opitutales bacterium]
MRILSVCIRNYRVHRELSASFEGPIVMVHGPNESGKSTLAEAIHCGLFLAAKGSTSLHKAMVPAHGGSPEVEIEFEAKGRRHKLQKLFGTSGNTSLESDGQATLNGSNAEDALAALLGVDGSVSGGGIENKMLRRWGHLWVWQGRSSETPLSGIEEAQDSLQQKLQAQTGHNLLSSATDNAVIKNLESWWDTNFTANGKARTGSVLDRAEKERTAAGELLEGKKAKLEVLRQAAQVYLQAMEDIKRYSQSLEASESQLKLLRGQLKTVEQLQRTLETKSRQREEAAKALNTLETTDREIRNLESQLDAARTKAGPASERLEQLEAAVRQARTELAEAQRKREQSAQELQAHRSACDSWQAHLNFLTEGKRIEELSKAQEKIRGLQQKRTELRQQWAPLEPLTAAALNKLRTAERNLESKQARLEAFALEIELLSGDQPVRLDGSELTANKPQMLSRSSELQVGEGTRIRLSPGGAKDLETARDAVEKALAARDECLRGLSVTTIDEAEEKRRRREFLEAELAKVEGPLEELHPNQVEAKLQAAGEAQARNQTQRDTLNEKGGIDAFPQDIESVEDLLETSREAMKQAGMKNQRAEESEKAAFRTLEEADKVWSSAKASLEEQNRNISDLTSRLSYAVGNSGDTAARSAAINTARAAFDQASAAENCDKEQLEKLGASKLEIDQQRLEQSIEKERQHLNEAERRQIEAQSQLNSNGTVDPERDCKEAEAELERCTRKCEQLQRKANVRRLLLERLQAARQEVSETLTKPLEDAVTPYLKYLFGGSCARIGWTPDGSRLESFELDRSDQSKGRFDFANLSHGTREQVALALRLAMAGLLAEDHDSCLPIVLDDAFTHADKERIEKLKTLLYQGGRKGLQIILLTCHPENYSGLSASEVSLQGR